MDTVFVGIDLGTFNVAVACSNGLREVVQNVVGWPKDHVARKVIGRDIVFGEEIHQHRLALDIVRPFQKGALKFNELSATGVAEADTEKYVEAARLLVKHAISVVKPPQGAQICGVVGTPSRASLLNKQVLLEIAEGALDVAMLVPEPFAVGYGTDHLVDTLVVDIGAGTIDLCPMYGALPAEQDQVTVPFGGDFVDEDFRTHMQAAYPEARLSLNMAREIKEKHGFVWDDQKTVSVKLPASGHPPREFDVTGPLRQACETVISAIVQGVHELIGRLDPEFHQAILSNIVLSGGGSQLKGLDQALEEALSEYGCISVNRVYDTVFAGAMGSLGLAMNMPAEHWDGLRAMTPARAA